MADCLKIGISSCLLGNDVRYDGGHSRSDIIIESMSDLFELIPFCPEVAIGMTVPRPTINLIAINGEIRVRGVSNISHDVTDALSHYAISITKQLNEMCGYIFKSRSPSCGLDMVNVYDEAGAVVGVSAGQFAKIITQQHPELPTVDEVNLLEKEMRDNFIQRVVSYSKKNN